jgi:hypothetical protein
VHDVRDEQVHLAARKGLTACTARQAATAVPLRTPPPPDRREVCGRAEAMLVTSHAGRPLRRP